MARTRRVWSWAAWVLGVAAVVVLVHRIGVAAVMGALLGVGPRILWLMAAYAGATTLMALPWLLLLRADERPSPVSAVASRFAGSGLNAVLPLVVAGDAVRLLWLPRSAWARGGAALVVDRLMFALASVVFLVVGAVAVTRMPGVPGQLAWTAILVASLTAIGVVLLLWLASRGRTLAPLQRLIVRLRGKMIALPGGEAPSNDLLVAMDSALKELLVTARRTLGLALLIHLLARLFAALEIYLGLRALNVPVTAGTVVVLAAVPIALTLVGAVIPGQIGLQEGASAAVAAALGLGATTGLSLVLLVRIRQLLFIPVTVALLSFRLHRLPPPSLGAAGCLAASENRR